MKKSCLRHFLFCFLVLASVPQFSFGHEESISSIDPERFTLLNNNAVPGFGVYTAKNRMQMMNSMNFNTSMSEEDKAHQDFIDIYNDTDAIIKPSVNMINLSLRMKVERDFKYESMINFYKAHGIQNVDPSCELALQIEPQEWKEHMEVFNQQKCFTNRLPRATTIDQEYEAIELAKKSCNCVKEHPINQAAWSELEQKAPPADTALLNDLKTNVEDKAQVLNDDFTAMLLQASSYAPNKSAAEAMASQYTQTVQDTQATIAKAKETVTGQAKDRLAEINADKNYSAEIAPIVDLIKPPELPATIMANMEKNAGECFTMQMYLQKKQNEKDIGLEFAFEGTNGQYKPEDWNYNDLTKAYDDKMREIANSTGQERINSQLDADRIKSKMTFLIRNPLIKNIFMARTTDMDDSEIDEDFINNKQRRLFQITYENFTSKKAACVSTSFVCLRDKRKSYADRMERFFKDQNVTYIAKMTAKGELDRSMDRPEDLQKLFESSVRTTYTGLEQAFFKKYKMTTHDCAGENIKSVEDCVQAFTKYCPMVDKAVEALANKSFAEGPSVEVEKAEREKMGLNPTTNLEYVNERKRVCEDSWVDANGVKSSYPKYKKTYCEGIPDNKCLANFSQRFNHHHKSANSGPTETQEAMAISMVADNASATTITSSAAKRMSDNAVRAKDSRKYNTSYFSEKMESSAQGLSKSSKAETVQQSKTHAPIKDYQAEVPVTSATPNMATPALLPPADAKKHSDKVTKEKKATEAKIKETEKAKSELEQSGKSNSSEADSLRKKLEGLESTLRMQEKKLADYQAMMDRPAGTDTRPGPTGNRGAKGPSESREDETKHTSFAAAAPAGTAETGADARATTGPSSSSGSSLGPSGSITGAGSAGGTTRVSSKATGEGKIPNINNALLSRYGIIVSNDDTGNVVVARPRESDELQILNTDPNTQVVPMNVSRTEYDKFKSNDLSSLEKIYADKLKDLSSHVLRINISSGKQEPLEFYAIKDNGRVYFQPVRKNKLETLNTILKQ